MTLNRGGIHKVRWNKMLCSIFFCSVIFLLGCGEENKVVPDKIISSSGNCLAVTLGEELKFIVTVPGKSQKTAFGGKKKVNTANAALLLEISQMPKGAAPVLANKSLITDAGGAAEVILRNILLPGVYKIKVSLKDYPDVKPLIVSLMGGLTIQNDHQDGWSGGVLEKPIQIKAESAPGVPMAGVKFEYDLRKAPKKTKLRSAIKVTNSDGIASFDVGLGSKQGQGIVGVRVISKPWNIEQAAPDLKVTFFTLDRWTLIVQIAGGLAIFIFGMKLMSEGLSLVAGEKLRSFLNFLTKNRFAAVGMGALVTGFIQSSSACSVMVIGFINAGLMRLEQAIGVIMGANIGTTVTAQMLSFKLSNLALPAIAIGVLITFIAKKQSTRFLAQILVGFGFLFFGMGLMSGPLKELKDSQTVQSIFDGLSCAPDALGVLRITPFLKAILAGTLITVIVQSSSAAIGLLFALAGAGLMDVYTGFGILMGFNIGTTITAILASFGSSISAKRTACAHVIFNVTGAVAMLALIKIPYNGEPVFLTIVGSFTEGDAFVGENIPRFLANAHTLFNVICTAVFIWLITPLAWLTRKIITGKEEIARDIAERILEPHLLATPALALQQAWQEVGIMIGKGHEAITASSRSIAKAGSQNDSDFHDISQEVKYLETDVDKLQTAVTDYVTNISQEILTEEQSAALPKLLHAVNDAERIGDHSMHILRLARRVRKRTLQFTAPAQEEIEQMLSCLGELFACSTKMLNEKKSYSAHWYESNLSEAQMISSRLKEMSDGYRKLHVRRHEAGDCDIRSGVVYLEIMQNLNRVGGHLLNIIEAATASASR